LASYVAQMTNCAIVTSNGMNISWYGQSCFRLESKGVSVLIDPFSKDIGLKPPRLNDNIFLITHNHYDHANLSGVADDAFIVRNPGEYEKAGIFIEGIRSFHDDVEGKERGLNTIYTIKTEDMKLCHLGDIGQAKLTDEQIEAIGDIDILFIPVGGVYTIDGAQAAEIVNEIEPKIIIPMHYQVPGLNIKLDGPQKFIKEIGLKPQEFETYKINKKTLPAEEIQLVTFKL
jgi:L-ascorbate metabolism protein UlaG (beta-lactamase superfamily)